MKTRSEILWTDEDSGKGQVTELNWGLQLSEVIGNKRKKTHAVEKDEIQYRIESKRDLRETKCTPKIESSPCSFRN